MLFCSSSGRLVGSFLFFGVFFSSCVWIVFVYPSLCPMLVTKLSARRERERERERKKESRERKS